MSKQPEALRLADALEDTDGAHDHEDAAAELRRLHEVNTDLLEALHLLLEGIDATSKRNGTVFSGFGIDQARAAITKATGSAA